MAVAIASHQKPWITTAVVLLHGTIHVAIASHQKPWITLKVMLEKKISFSCDRLPPKALDHCLHIINPYLSLRVAIASHQKPWITLIGWKESQCLRVAIASHQKPWITVTRGRLEPMQWLVAIASHQKPWITFKAWLGRLRRLVVAIASHQKPWITAFFWEGNRLVLRCDRLPPKALDHISLQVRQ